MTNFIIEFIKGFYFGITRTIYLIYFYSKKLYISSLIVSIPLVFMMSFGIRILPVNDISSMNNTYHGNELILYIRVYNNSNILNSKDVVLVESYSQGIDLIKRVVALPNDTIEIIGGKTIVNGIAIEEDGYKIDYPYEYMKEITLSDNEYFLMGDNRPASLDSRSFGPIINKEIKGKVILTILPTPSKVRK